MIQQLEAIWTGKIVFHSALDQLHRMKDTRKYSVNTMSSMMPFRRSATLYDARDASLFKLSRLRVPRYKHITSTFSLAILLFLYVNTILFEFMKLIIKIDMSWCSYGDRTKSLFWK